MRCSILRPVDMLSASLLDTHGVLSHRSCNFPDRIVEFTERGVALTLLDLCMSLVVDHKRALNGAR